MGTLNRAQIIGNLGRDAELRYTVGGQAVAGFSVATTERWTDKAGEKQERTTWHRCALWGKRAEGLAPYLAKGKQVYVEGRIEHSEYTDRDGAKKSKTEIVVLDVQLLGGGERSGERPASQPRQAMRGSDGGDQREPGGDDGPGGGGRWDQRAPLTDDDIPF
jgi:single-strand DNA-binding protein